MSRKRVKVCVLGARGIPGVSGGVESHCQELLPRLAARNGDLRIRLLARRNYVKERRFTHAGVEVVATSAPRHQYLEAWTHTLGGVLHARFNGARIAHFHAIGPALFAPLAKALGMKVIVTHHSQNYLHAKWNRFARMALKMGEWSAVTFADRVITVSPSLTEDLRSRYRGAARRIVHIPNGASEFPVTEKSADHGGVLSPFGLQPRRYVLAVGRLTPEKGFHDLVAAFEQADTDLDLVIAGGADFESDYVKSLRSHASERIVFAGFQDRRALYSLYRNAALFVLPSHHEGMPIAALEAISLGAPVLLSDIQANRDLALPAHHYFPKGDVEALSARLSQSYDELRIDPQAAAKIPSWDEVARLTGRVYDALLPPRAAGRALVTQE